MEAATTVHTDKQLYRNNTAGWLGVVTLDYDGKPVGTSVEPHGSVWLSDAEALLTARAPRRPEDNPFEQQVFIGVNPETQAREEFVMRPLTPELSSDRYVPAERYVPGVTDTPREGTRPPEQTAAARAEAPGPPSSATGAQPPAPVPPVAPQGAPTPPQRTTDEPDGSWIEPPVAPGQVIRGSLQGGDLPPDAESAPDSTNAPTQDERYVPPVVAHQAAPQMAGAEEHAQTVDPKIGEETGQAQPPAEQPPEGEYAQAEEVGSPEAPQRSAEDQTLIGE